MNRILAFIFFIASLFASNSFGQQLEGNWKGAIDVQGTQLNIITSFSKSDRDIIGTIDIPQQGASDIKLEKILISESDSVFFQFNAGPGRAKFKGVFLDSNKIEGNFYQRDMAFPFKLKREEKQTN